MSTQPITAAQTDATYSDARTTGETKAVAAPTLTFRYSYARNKYDHTWKPPIARPWDDFCAAMERGSSNVSGSKDGLALIPAIFAAGTRQNDENVVAMTALGLDIDADLEKGMVHLPFDAVHRLLPYACIAYSTFSNTVERPRYRVLYPFLGELEPAQFRAVWDWANQVTGGHLMDPSCKNLSRLYYAPRSPAQAIAAGLAWVRRGAGPFLSVSEVPRDVAFTQSCSRVASKRVHTGLHLATPSEAEARSVIEEIQEHPVFRWAVEYPSQVNREVWRGIATNLACAAAGHSSLLEAAWNAFDQLSAEDDERYRPGETLRTWSAALDSAKAVGPMTFAHMIENGVPAHLCSAGATTLITAARKIARAKELLNRASSGIVRGGVSCR